MLFGGFVFEWVFAVFQLDVEIRPEIGAKAHRFETPQLAENHMSNIGTLRHPQNLKELYVRRAKNLSQRAHSDFRR